MSHKITNQRANRSGSVIHVNGFEFNHEMERDRKQRQQQQQQQEEEEQQECSSSSVPTSPTTPTIPTTNVFPYESIDTTKSNLQLEHNHTQNVSQVEYTSVTFQQRVKQINELIDNEFKEYGAFKQFERDAYLWRKTLSNPEIPTLGKILKRVFTLIRYGGLMFRTNESSKKAMKNSKSSCVDWKFWNATKYPIAAAVSHGSRIIIQLPKASKTSSDDYDNSFWKWLITGDPDGDLSKYVSTATSGSEARREGKLLFKRLGATHALDYAKEEELVLLDSLKYNYFKQQTTEEKSLRANSLPTDLNMRGSTDNNEYEDQDTDMDGPSSKYDLEEGKYNMHLPKGRRKILLETKTSGVTLRDTKVFRNSKYIYTHHRHWGLNIPLGGAGGTSMSGKLIEANGEHGHMYLYYMSPKKDRYGGLMIGVEGSEYGKYDQNAGYHGLSAKSPQLGPTFGFKWRCKKDGRDLSSIESPDKYNSMLIDLTKTGWEFLIEKAQNEWQDDFVTKPALPVDDLRSSAVEKKNATSRLAGNTTTRTHTT
jgi:hypothetical protein